MNGILQMIRSFVLMNSRNLEPSTFLCHTHCHHIHYGSLIVNNMSIKISCNYMATVICHWGCLQKILIDSLTSFYFGVYVEEQYMPLNICYCQGEWKSKLKTKRALIVFSINDRKEVHVNSYVLLREELEQIETNSKFFMCSRFR